MVMGNMNYMYKTQFQMYINAFVRKAILTHLVADFGAKKNLFVLLIDKYFTTNPLLEANSIEVCFEKDEKHKAMTHAIVDLCVEVNELNARLEGQYPKVFPGYFHSIIYTYMRLEQIWDNSVKNKPVKLKYCWLVEFDNNVCDLLVSGYTWDIVIRKYPSLTDAKHTSLIKLDMDSETVAKYNDLIQNNPWCVVNLKGEVSERFDKELFTSDQWATEQLKVSDLMLKEDGARLLRIWEKSNK